MQKVLEAATKIFSEPQTREWMKALCNAYRDRRRRKRDFRRLWISRINASARINGTNYSKLINGMKNAEIIINRKMLAQLALNDPKCFEKIVSSVSK